METLPGLPRLGHASTVSVCFSPAVENFLYLKSRQASFDAGGEINFVKKNSAFSFLSNSTSWYVLPFLCFCSQDFPLFLIIHLSSPLSNVQSKRLFLTGENLPMFFEVVVAAVTVVIISAFFGGLSCGCSSSCCSRRWWSSSGCWLPCCSGSSCNNRLSCCSPNYIPTGCSGRLLCCFCCLYGFRFFGWFLHSYCCISCGRRQLA